MPALWPRASYFDTGTADALLRMSELEFVDRANWYELYRHNSDGTYWRLDADDKYQQRYLVQIDAPAQWSTFDSRSLELALLLEVRGGLSAEVCIQQGCNAQAIKGSAFCLEHTFERGVRK